MMQKLIDPPFRWTGGKRELLPTILRYFPKEFNNYYEPFLGSGAVALNLPFQNKTVNCYLSDTNQEIINFFSVLHRHPEELIDELTKGYYAPEYNNYITIRSKDNPNRVANLPPIKRAARLVYLQAYSVRGLYRVNKKGGFNVPRDKSRVHAKLFNPDLIRRASMRLSCNDLYLNTHDFFMQEPKEGDFVYLDPPYRGQFDQYTPERFPEKLHLAMAEKLDKWTSEGVKWMMSNSPEARELYERKYPIIPVTKRMSFNNSSTPIQEILVCNYRFSN